MGLFNFGKKEKKQVSKKEKHDEPFEPGPNGMVFNAKIQIIASPKEYAQKIADGYIDDIKARKDMKQKTMFHILKKNISKPEKLKEEEKEDEQEKKVDLFKILIDLEIGIKDKSNIFDFCFNFMPFSIEVIQPMSTVFSAADLTDYLTSIQSTIHKIDFALKQTKAANDILNKRNENLTHNMVRMLRNNILLSLKEKDKDTKELAKNVGLTEEQLKPFIENMLKDKEIKQKGGKYSRA